MAVGRLGLNAHAARLVLNCNDANQVIGEGYPLTQILLDFADLDTDGYADLANHAIVIPPGLPGIYRVHAMVTFASQAGNTAGAIGVLANVKHGAHDVISYVGQIPNAPAGAENYGMDLGSIDTYLAAGTSLTMEMAFTSATGTNKWEVFSCAGTDPNQDSGTEGVFFEVSYLGQ